MDSGPSTTWIPSIEFRPCSSDRERHPAFGYWRFSGRAVSMFGGSMNRICFGITETS